MKGGFSEGEGHRTPKSTPNCKLTDAFYNPPHDPPATWFNGSVVFTLTTISKTYKKYQKPRLQRAFIHKQKLKTWFDAI